MSEREVTLEADPLAQGPLDGRVAVVTGAGRGIGRAVARAYARAGAAVVCAARTASQVQETVHTIEQSGGKALAVPTDVTDRQAVQALMQQAVDTYGGLDLLVINAGGALARTGVADSRPEDFVGTLEVNLTAAYYCAYAAIPHLRARGAGKIITVGSGMGHRGSAGNAAYSVAKAGLWMLTRVLAQELVGDNISVNELIPGPVRTDATQAVADQPGTHAAFGVPGEWVKTPEDVVPLALFLATQPAVGPTAQSFSLMRRDG